MNGLSHSAGATRRLLALALSITATLAAWPLLQADGRSEAETREMRIAGAPFVVELAVTADEHHRGLMYRPGLAEGRGMLFIYPSDAPRAFWMKNVRIPIDILFLDGDGKLVGISPRAAPCRRDPCPLYRSGAPARYVLELPAGTAERLGLRAGDRLELPDDLPATAP